MLLHRDSAAAPERGICSGSVIFISASWRKMWDPVERRKQRLALKLFAICSLTWLGGAKCDTLGL